MLDDTCEVRFVRSGYRALPRKDKTRHLNSRVRMLDSVDSDRGSSGEWGVQVKRVGQGPATMLSRKQ